MVGLLQGALPYFGLRLPERKLVNCADAGCCYDKIASLYNHLGTVLQLAS